MAGRNFTTHTQQSSLIQPKESYRKSANFHLMKDLRKKYWIERKNALKQLEIKKAEHKRFRDKKVFELTKKNQNTLEKTQARKFAEIFAGI